MAVDVAMVTSAMSAVLKAIGIAKVSATVTIIATTIGMAAETITRKKIAMGVVVRIAKGPVMGIATGQDPRAPAVNATPNAAETEIVTGTDVPAVSPKVKLTRQVNAQVVSVTKIAHSDPVMSKVKAPLKSKTSAGPWKSRSASVVRPTTIWREASADHAATEVQLLTETRLVVGRSVALEAKRLHQLSLNQARLHRAMPTTPGLLQ